MLDPTDNTLLANLNPVTVNGGAYATNYLKSLTVKANNTVIYSANYPQADQIVDQPWTTSWTPPGNGTYTLVSTATDWQDNVQTDCVP